MTNPSPSTIKSTTVNGLLELAKQGKKPTVIDVRTTAEFAEVHASLVDCNIPLDTISPAAMEKHGFGNKNAPYFLICRSGARSMKACELLAAAGYTDLTNVSGGTLAWVAAGFD